MVQNCNRIKNKVIIVQSYYIVDFVKVPIGQKSDVGKVLSNFLFFLENLISCHYPLIHYLDCEKVLNDSTFATQGAAKTWGEKKTLEN